MFHGLHRPNTPCLTCTCGWERVDSSSQNQSGADGLYDSYASALAALGGCCFMPQWIVLNKCPSGLSEGAPAQAQAA